MQREHTLMAPPSRSRDELPFADIGARLKQLREMLGKNQSEMARALKLKPHTYNAWEKGQRRPKLESALTMREEFGISLDWLYAGSHPSMELTMLKALREGKRRR